LLYVSDYLSFMGRDRHGWVAFALDTNRGRDGDAYQAEHFVALHDEREGWVKVLGYGPYENPRRELAGMPDSPDFRFEGAPASGLVIVSATNGLTLRIEPLAERLRRTHDGAVFGLGSAAASLSWRGRTIPGRVIHEHLMRPHFNRLTRTHIGMWKEFQGWYLLVDGRDDLYLHSQLSERSAPLVGKLVGFAAWDAETDPVGDLEVTVLARDWALGLYRWPVAWRMTWTGRLGPASLSLALSDRRVFANWLIGGFAMGMARGELTYAGQTRPVLGLAELIM
jgi:hypothetical protein